MIAYQTLANALDHFRLEQGKSVLNEAQSLPAMTPVWNQAEPVQNFERASTTNVGVEQVVEAAHVNDETEQMDTLAAPPVDEDEYPAFAESAEDMEHGEPVDFGSDAVDGDVTGPGVSNNEDEPNMFEDVTVVRSGLPEENQNPDDEI